MVLNKSILIGAIGQKDTGKSTVLCFLAENFYDNDVLCKAHDCSKSRPEEFATYFSPHRDVRWTNHKTFSYPIIIEETSTVILVDNIKETDAHIIKSLNGIIVKVVRNQYDNNI
jgi:hypothetical protein